MKKILICTLIALTLMVSHVYGQGWYVEVDLDLNHGLYAFENISKATLTFSGVTVSGSSTNSNLNLIVKGTGPMSGAITLTVNGTAFEPYDRNDPYSQPLSAQYSGNYDVTCQTGFFQKSGDIPNSELYIWVRIHPRLAISDFVQLCDQITLTTPTCSPTFQWEVSDSPTGNFKPLTGKSTSTIVVTRQELINLGFANTYGRKYFRVTGLPNTTSQLQPVEIFYPGPTASFQLSPPKCHDGSDGSITVNIQSALPSGIDDFVVTLFKAEPPNDQFLQDFINDNSEKTFSGLKAESYWVRIENNTNIAEFGNCWTDYPAGTLSNPDRVTLSSEVSSYNGYGVRCTGTRDGMIKVLPSGGSGTYSKFEWAPQVSTTNVASNLSSGEYQVKVSDSYGCWSDAVTNVLTEPDALSVQLVSTGGKSGYDVSCHNKSDGVIESTVSGGVPMYNYLWSDRNITPWIKDLAAGQYGVSVTDANGCGASATISLAAPPPIDFHIEEINGINCPGEKSGTLEIVSVFNTIGQNFYSWSSGASSIAITDIGSGTYSATVSDEQGCSASKSHTLAEPAVHTAQIVPTSDFHGVPIQCHGTATGKLRAIVHDAAGNLVAPQEFTWYRNNLFYQSGPHLETLTDVDAATYRAEIRYTSHCTTEATFVLNEPDAISAGILSVSNYNGTAISCNGSADATIRAEASGGTGELSFLWDTGETSATLAGLREGTYEVNVTDVNGCSAQAASVLSDPEPVEVNIAILSDFHGAAISCANASDARLGATARGGTGPYAFAWSTGQTGNEVDNITAGTHSVTATDANGCQGQNDSVILAPTPLLANIIEISDYHGYGVSCAATRDGFMRAAGSGGTGEYNYRWTETGATTPLNANLGAGNYTVIVQDENGCSASADASIAAPDLITLTTSTIRNVSCHGGSNGEVELTPQGGTGLYKYSANGVEWQTQPRLINLKAGIYHATVQDENGCKASISDTLTQPLPIEITFDEIVPALCGEPQGKISATVTGGTLGYEYSWTDANARNVGNEASATALYAGLYSLTVTDAHQCQATRTAGITATDGPAIQVAKIVSTSCSYIHDGRALIEVTSGDGPFTYRWQDGQTTPEGVQLKKGNHIVEVRDINDCAAVTSLTIPSPDSLMIEMTSQVQPQCFGDCNGSISVAAQGGSGSYHYDWGISKGEQLNNLCSGAYTVTVTDRNECAASQTFQITQPDALTIKVLSQKSPACPDNCDGSIELQARGGTGELSYTWNNGQTGTVISDLCADSFTAHVTDTRGCDVTETFTLETPVIRSIDLGESVTLCEGQTHTLDAGADWNTHLWSANNGFTSEMRSVTLTEAGMYWVEATTFEGCVARDTFLLQTSTDLLNASFLMPSEATISDTVVMIDISWPMPENIVWKFPHAMVQLESPADMVYGKFELPGTYDIGLMAALGACRDEVTKTITILNQNDVSKEGRLDAEPFIKQFTLYPNPNDGMFDVVVEFREESPVILTVWNILTSTRIARIDVPTDTHHQQHIDLRPLSAGSYSLRLDYSEGTKYIRFIVN